MEHLDLLNNDLQVSSTSQKFLTEAARWGKFLSVIGFIFCGLLAIASFFAPGLYSKMAAYQSLSSEMARGVSVVITLIYLCFAVVLFFPSLYLNKFSSASHSSRFADRKNCLIKPSGTGNLVQTAECGIRKDGSNSNTTFDLTANAFLIFVLGF